MRNYLERLNRMPEAWDSGSVDVSGPTSSTDNAVVRWDGTGARTLQNSVVTVGDTGAVAGVTTLGMSSTLTITGTATVPINSIRMTGTTTAANFIRLDNTGGEIRIGLESSAAGTNLIGSLAYATFIDTVSATALQFATSDTVRQTIFANGNVAIGTTTDNTAKLQVVGNFTATQIFAVGDSGAGVSSTVAITNVTTESMSSGVCTILSTGATARSSTGWVKIYSGTGVRYIPYFTTISG